MAYCLAHARLSVKTVRMRILPNVSKVVTPVQTVGAMGNARTYEFVCSLRAVTSTEHMSTDFYHFDAEFLVGVAGRIINEVRSINRVVSDKTSKPPYTTDRE